MVRHNLSEYQKDFLYLCRGHSVYRAMYYEYQLNNYLGESEFNLLNRSFKEWSKLRKNQQNEKMLSQLIGTQRNLRF